MTVELFRFLVVLAAATVVGCICLVRRQARGRKDAHYLKLVLWSELLIVLGYLFEHLSPSLEAKLFWDGFQFCFDGAVALCFVLFAAEYTGRRFPRPVAPLLLGLTTLASVVLATSPWHGLTRRGAALVAEPMLRLTYPFEPLDYLLFLQIYALFFIGVGLLVRSGFLRHRLYLSQITTLTLSILIPAVGSMLSFTPVRILGERDFAPFFFTLGAAASAFGLLRSRVFELAPVARDLWVESQGDAILVLDGENHIVDANPAGESFVRAVSALSSAIGHGLDEALPDFVTADAGQSEEGRRLEVDGTTWELRRFPIDNRGWLLVGRDISSLAATERALALANRDLESRVSLRTRQLGQANDKFRAIFENAHHFISLLDAHGVILAANRAALDRVGLPSNEVLGQRLAELSWWTREPTELRKLHAALAAARSGRFARFEAYFSQQAGEYYIDCSFKPVMGEGVVELIIFEGQDVTDARKAEQERARKSSEREHAERMEMLGRLAGGIAHDFNNLLTIVLAATAVLRDGSSDTESDEAVSDIEQAAASATLVTRQLLSLSRRGIGKVEPTDVHAAVTRMSKLLDRLLGERHQLELELAVGAPYVLIDSGQLEQCIMNLVINARDAMPEGGVVSVTTRVERAQEHQTSSGDQLILAVQDRGVGMSEEVKSQVFEAFFTTKAAGHGTGLGLSTVHEIVTVAHGTIHLKSKPFEGSTFELRFPTCNSTPSRSVHDESEDCTGTETLAFVEDVAQLRELMGRELRRLGYDVHTFASAEQALEQLQGVDLHLLITDVILPGTDGVELAARLRRERGDFPVVYTTGYSGDAALDLGDRDPHSSILFKPYRPLALALCVRALLNQRKPGA